MELTHNIVLARTVGRERFVCRQVAPGDAFYLKNVKALDFAVPCRFWWALK
jgi:hypothetical protein